MNKYISRGLWCALFVGGLTVFGATAANAADTGGADGLLSGNQVVGSITVPVGISGNAISVLGDGSSTDSAPVAARPATADGAGQLVTDGRDGVVSGNQVAPDVVVPVVVAGNAVSVLGDSSSIGSAPVADRPGQATPAVGNDRDVADGIVPALVVGFTTSPAAEDTVAGSAAEPATTGSTQGELEVADGLEPQALADTGGAIGTSATAALLLLGAGLTLMRLARRKSLGL